uniref:peptidylprolyl isomerase n=1 Tax=Photinus pyralis TaxID=7054 RepID=A0A1Y1KRE4_PHOPY
MSEYETSSLASDTSSTAPITDIKSDVTLSDSDLLEDVNTVKPNDNDVPKKGEWEDILGSGSLMKKVIQEGKPDSRPQRLDNCIVNYTCTLEDGTSVERKEKFKVQLGDYEVIQGLDLALGLMNLGELSQLKIHSRLAYGQKGLDNLVPPDTTVHFEVELVAIEPDDEPELLSIQQRRVKGNDKRERGNWWYSRGENQIAIQCYRRALEYLDEVEGGIQFPTDDKASVSDSALQQLLEDRIHVSNNMAAAQLKLELYDAALQSLQTVLRCQPDNVKALFRKARVHKAKNDVQTALSCLKKAEKLSPQDADILKEIASLEKIKEKQKQSEKELARRMFNGLSNGKESRKKKTLQ